MVACSRSMTAPFVCVIAAFVLIWVPRMFVAVAQGRRPEGYDNQNPRDQQSRLEGWGKRAQGAHMNSFEAFAPFAAAVFVAHLGGGDPGRSATLAIAFVALRIVYTALYIANLDKVRSVVWLMACGATCGLFCLPWLK